MAPTCRNLLRANEIERLETAFHHPWNAQSEILGVHLSEALGLERVGVSLARIPPRKESFVYHAHHHEEEWLYILSGCGVAQVDDQEFAVGPGDFLAFPTPSVAHHLRNPFDHELVYLMGGEHREFEVADFPLLGKRMVRSGEQVTTYDLADGRPFGPLDGTAVPRPAAAGHDAASAIGEDDEDDRGNLHLRTHSLRSVPPEPDNDHER